MLKALVALRHGVAGVVEAAAFAAREEAAPVPPFAVQPPALVLSRGEALVAPAATPAVHGAVAGTAAALVPAPDVMVVAAITAAVVAAAAPALRSAQLHSALPRERSSAAP